MFDVCMYKKGLNVHVVPGKGWDGGGVSAGGGYN
jgi:hypothetical protein